MCRNQHNSVPCFHCHPHSYIRMVQHMIERCLILRMSTGQCVKALTDHAGIRPRVTLTVLRELQKENKEFFEEYFHAISPHRPLMAGRHIERKSRSYQGRTNWK